MPVSAPKELDTAHPINDEEGRVTTAVFQKFVLVNTYTPCSGFDKPERESFRRKYERLMRKKIKCLRKKYDRPVILMGDLNVTACPSDV